MLSEKVKRDYKESMYELYAEVGTTKILYYALDKNSQVDDIYGEIEKVYLPPINLVGTITPLQPTEDPTMFASNIDTTILKFDIIGLSLENNNLNPNEMLTGYFEFDGVKHTINKVTPKGLFTDFFTSYEFVTEVVK